MGVKEYELPNGRKAVFEFDENGVGKITIEAMDLLMGLIKADLVTCGECKWWNGIGCAIQIVDESDKPKETDFCSFGERRADEHTD